MSNTSNRWKSQGGINRRAANNILSNNKQATNTLTIPQQLGISNTTIEQYGDVHDISNTVLNNTQIGGILDISGQMKVYNEATFYKTAYFKGGIMDSVKTVIYDSSAANHINIFTTSEDTTNKASIFIQNARGVPNSDHHMPSMLVYNQQPQTTTHMNTSSIDKLIFSISGENVSIGEIYGQNTFDVNGNSSFLGNVGIGKANPESTLDVDGSVNISGETSIDNSLNVANNITSRGSIILDQSSSNITIGDSIGQIQISNNNGSYFDSFNSSISFRTVDTNNTDTNTRLFIDASNGNVGIGTNNITPLYTLDISGTLHVSSETILDSSLNVKGVARFNDIAYGKSPEYSANGLELPTCEWIKDYIQADGGWINEKNDNDIYNSNIGGNIGIGTKEPEYTLDVSGDIYMTGDFMVGGDIDLSGSIVSIGSIKTKQNATINGNAIIDGSANIYGDVKLESNVGIGLGETAIDPSFVLDISGDMYSNGNILTRGNVGIGARGTEVNGVQLGKNEPEVTLDVGGTMRVSGKVNFMGPVYGPAPTTSSEIHDASYGLQLVTMTWVADAIGASGGWIADNNFIYNGNIDNEDAYVGIGTKIPTATLDVSGNTNLNGNLDVSGVCSMIQESGFSGKDKINIIPIPNPVLTDFSGNTSNINMWGTFTNTGGYDNDNGPRQTATIQSGYSNQINSSVNNPENFEGAWGSEYLSFKVGNLYYNASTNILQQNSNTSSMTASTFSDISGVDLNNEVMRITAEGNVGIGTDSPTSTLDVSGTTTLSQGIHIGSKPYDNNGKGIQPTGAIYPVVQGTSIQWNRDGGTGLTYIMNNKGGGTGGFSFGDISNNNDYTEMLFMDNLPSGQTYDATSHNDILLTPIVNTLRIYPSSAKEGGMDGGVGYVAQTIGVNIKQPDASGNIYKKTASGGITGASAINFCADGESGGSDSAQFSIWTSPQDSSVDSQLEQRVSVCGNGNVGIGTDSPTSTLDVSGNITATTFNATSDLRLKENIHDLSNSLEKICAIRGVEYNWKADETKKLHSGVIAQEVKESIPEAVNSENKEQYSVDYNAIIGHLIEAVKTLKQEVDDLKGQMKK